MKHIVIVGGGYAGINTLEHLKKQLGNRLGHDIRMTLIDKHSYHLRKVLLFRRISDKDFNLHIPLTSYTGEGISFVQGEVEEIKEREQAIVVTRDGLKRENIPYDQLVLAMGSSSRHQEDQGGIPLESSKNADLIRSRIEEGIKAGKSIHIAVVGAGISGVETAAEMGGWLKDSGTVKVTLVNADRRLLSSAPKKVSAHLEEELTKVGVNVLHGVKVNQYDDQAKTLYYSDGTTETVDLCIWTTGLKSNVLTASREKGRIMVDESYRVKGMKNVYSIGDCALVTDAKTGRIDRMTCKEAVLQSGKLSRIMVKDMTGSGKRLVHKSIPVEFYCVSLGQNRALVWMKKGKYSMLIRNRLALFIRKSTWDSASLIKK
ncbi:FAD-dependent oxidoreductase [Bacillus sp. MCCB 382]|uniref:NAD(P)/FAD-dependent oxidoreductase n=1 Tax=Bacillus sp. MCCB 382 TaxID=2860197 RepID=UPI001C57E66A|nr:FAD-dependent oxidoreductase [Bacillus sp. MCCB 382]